LDEEYILKVSLWNKSKIQLSAIRREVFIQEQKVPEELEWDEFDVVAEHILVLNKENRAIATGRIKADGHIGRMAVLKTYRQKGIGSEILLALLVIAKNNNLSRVYLHAQVSAITFYEKQGFICSSDEFLDAGIPHKSMIKIINEE